MAFIPGSAFYSGTIELALRGKDVPQRSFIGVAFHGVDATAYDAVYFRPFNFKAGDPMGRSHSVQYISIPGYTWDVLRGRFQGKYEQAVNPVPDPNGWFRARVEVKNRVASVFVDNATGPSLVVELLGKSNGGLIGLYVGNTSGGDFASLSISGA